MLQRIYGPRLQHHRSQWANAELLDMDFLEEEREESPFTFAEQLEALRPLTHNNPQS